MRVLVPNGVWEIFIPSARAGHRYKFEIRARSGECLLKSDPFGFAFEAPPLSASIVSQAASRVAGRRVDAQPRAAWCLARQADGDLRGPSRIVGSACPRSNRYLTYAELAERLIPYVKEMGYTHIELLPVMEHPVLRFVGLSGHRLLRADQPLWHARGRSRRSSTPAIGTASA